MKGSAYLWHFRFKFDIYLFILQTCIEQLLWVRYSVIPYIYKEK